MGEMNLNTAVLLEWSILLALGVISLSLVLVFVRLLIGPTLPDRVVALDTISFFAIGFIAMFTLVARQPFFLDAAITLALIAFLATIAFARYVERTRQDAGRGR